MTTKQRAVWAAPPKQPRFLWPDAIRSVLGKPNHWMRVGPYASEKSAEAMALKVRREYIPGVLKDPFKPWAGPEEDVSVDDMAGRFDVTTDQYRKGWYVFVRFHKKNGDEGGAE